MNIADTSADIFSERECVSTSLTNADNLAIGVPLDGALACPPLLLAVNFTPALPFSNTPTMAKIAGDAADRLRDDTAALVTD